MNPLYQDTHEPIDIYNLLLQSCPAEMYALNQHGNADWYWLDCQGNSRQIERKQWGELLSDVDSVEEQLRREIPLADQTDLLVEGVVQCTQYGLDAYVWKASRNEWKFSHSFGDKAHPQPGMYSKIWAWFWQLNAMGVSVWLTPSWEGTAKAIASFYHNSQKSEHSTLQRYLKPKPIMRDLNPHVNTLMGIDGGMLGHVRAEALIDAYGSVYAVLTADPKELAKVAGMGKATVNRLMRSIGRVV